MYSVSDEYKVAIRDSCAFTISGLVELANGDSFQINDKSLDEGSITIKQNCLSGSVLAFGGAVLGELSMSIIPESSRVSQYAYLDGVITLSVTAHLKDNHTEKIPMGKWIIAETKKVHNTISIRAYDSVFKLTKSYPGTALTGTPYNVLQLVAQACNITLGQTQEDLEALPNGNMPITLDADSNFKTYREVVAAVAQMCGGFVTSDRYGNIVIRCLHLATDFSLTKAQRYSSTISDFQCVYDCLQVSGNGGTFSSGEHFEVPGTLIMKIDDARGWDYGTEEILQQKTNTLFEYVDILNYTPSKVSLFADPAIDCGDKYALHTDTGVVYSYVTSYTWKYNSPMTIECVGENPYLTKDAVSSSSSRGGGGSGGSAQMFYYLFTNGSAYSISSKSETDLKEIANVSVTTTKDTSAEFHGILQLTVTSNPNVIRFMAYNSKDEMQDYEITEQTQATILIQYQLNGEDYSMLYKTDTLPGNRMISLYYPITSLEQDVVYQFSVRIGVLQGSINLGLGEFLGTVSGQGVVQSKSWDGNLDITETISPIAIDQISVHTNISDNVFARLVDIQPRYQITENISKISFAPLQIASATEDVKIEFVDE